MSCVLTWYRGVLLTTWQVHQLVSEFLHVLVTCGHIMNYAQDFLALSLLQSGGF